MEVSRSDIENIYAELKELRKEMSCLTQSLALLAQSYETTNQIHRDRVLALENKCQIASDDISEIKEIRVKEKGFLMGIGATVGFVASGISFFGAYIFSIFQR